MATISSSILSSTTYIHHHSTTKSFKTQLPISSKSNLSQTSLRFSISNLRQPTRLLCVAEETVVTVDPSSEAARRLYVGNIPRTTNNDELQKVFQEHGSIDKVEVFHIWVYVYYKDYDFVCIFTLRSNITYYLT